ncbi:chemotaxis protein CheW [Endozoicomonas sp. OPT23]|uniref:chemotaxis protein CheW n=1 Tax=Endozoicomonas sp. OPT23 TaxID=2072845 RepID=UPI00129BC9DB|nr:chemotaxis protein CheW [Endozoicomonas sp. OPT23]MRI31554.1 chemotaxis protein CheW [Endozoicomonas sp. OPT23]
MNTNGQAAPAMPFEHLQQLQQEARSNRFSLPEKQSEDKHWSGVSFTLNDQRFAVQIGEVLEILPVPDTTPLPGVQPWAKGVANVRGRLLPIIDLGEFLGSKRSANKSVNRIMVIEQTELAAGLIVDEVQGMVHFSASNFSEKLPVDLPDVVQPFSTGSYLHQDILYSVFSTELLTMNPRFLKAAIDKF